MSPYENDSVPFYLTFCEATILAMFISGQDKEGLISRLEDLSKHTSDPMILEELSNLKGKVHLLSEEEFAVLKEDTLSRKTLESSGYTLY